MAPYLLALDVGTSSVRCELFDTEGNVKFRSQKSVKTFYPHPGYVEINPDYLWEAIVSVMNDTVKGNNIETKDVKCMGISCQRSTFLTWNKNTGEPYHNFITWKDIRADQMVNNMNQSVRMKLLNFASGVLHRITGKTRFLAGSVLKFMNTQVTVRLLWVLKNIPQILRDAENNMVAFGTLDTWLLYKLSDSNLHVTDVSNASATGFFDPFTMEWCSWVYGFFQIPDSILPKVVDSAGDHFGSVSASILGNEIPIRSCIADQSASLFASMCFSPGDLKITLGTGTFLDVNTGSKPHASVAGLYPVIGWRYEGETVYVAEGASNDTGSLVNWALELGFIDDIEESDKLVESIGDNDGVYFIPAFSGIQAPINDSNAGTGFIGIKPTTQKLHMLRAIFESIAFRAAQLLKVFKDEADHTVSRIKVDGGVSKNNFILQKIANVTGIPVERPKNTELSSLGAILFAGLASGVWKDKDDLRELRKDVRVFEPSQDLRLQDSTSFKIWCDAIKRFVDWYDPDHDN